MCQEVLLLRGWIEQRYPRFRGIWAYLSLSGLELDEFFIDSGGTPLRASSRTSRSGTDWSQQHSRSRYGQILYQWVPCLGYLEKFEELNKKSTEGTLTPLEYVLVQKLDLADLAQYEQAREHSVELLEKWLSAYKFKNWNETQSTKKKVTPEMKQERAKKIAIGLNDTTRWHLHSRGISMDTLQNELGLIINDLSEEEKLNSIIKQLHRFVVDFMRTSEFPVLPAHNSL